MSLNSSHMDYGFDQQIDRQGTASLKWQRYLGRDVIPMWVADMDFRSPPEVLEALNRRVEHGVFGYPVPPAALASTVVERVRRLYGWTIEPDWIVWLPGVVVGLDIACRAIGREGDQVAVFTPVYPPFLSAPRLAGRELLSVPLAREGDRYKVDPDRFKAALTDRTKLLLWCHPHNPVGRAFGPQELMEVAVVCKERGIVICSDEIHCDLILDPDKPHVPTASLDREIAQRTITLMAPSKTFNVPGLGCAMAIIPDGRLRRQYLDARLGLVPHVNVFGYEAALAAYRHGEPWRKDLLEYLRGNRALLTATIRQIPGLAMGTVEATYLAWIDTRGLGIENPAHFFEEAGVGLSDGADFDGPGFVRLNFGCPREILKKALERMARAAAGLMQ